MQRDETMKGRVWQLLLGGTVLTEIAQTSYEFPWNYGDVGDLDTFNRVRAYFHDPDEWPDTPEFATLVELIEQNGGFRLSDTREGAIYSTFTLNADHDDDSTTVWFRHNAVEELDAEADAV